MPWERVPAHPAAPGRVLLVDVAAVVLAFVFREVLLGDDASRPVDLVAWTVLYLGLLVLAVVTGLIRPVWRWRRGAPR